MARLFLTVLLQSVALAGSLVADTNTPTLPVIGEEPALKRHIEQADIEAGRYTLLELIDHGEAIFTAQQADLLEFLLTLRIVAE